jgi:hypothetical protein
VFVLRSTYCVFGASYKAIIEAAVGHARGFLAKFLAFISVELPPNDKPRQKIDIE